MVETGIRRRAFRPLLGRTPDNGALIRRKMADAICHRTLGPEQFRRLTRATAYPTQELLRERLLELWRELWSGRNPADYCSRGDEPDW